MPYDVVRQKLGLLRRYGLELLIAIRPSDLPALPALLGACADAGVPVGAWPMLGDAEGRWANAMNAEAFCALARATRCGPLSEIAWDLEPPIEVVRRLGRDLGAIGRLAPPSARFDRARVDYAAAVEVHAAEGVPSLAAAVPVVLLDPIGGSAWQRRIGTPVDGPGFAHVSVMLYTSLFEGWSRGWVRRDDARALLAAGCRATRDRFGTRGGVSVGAVGVGAIGTEPVYRCPAELADDVAIARACGVDALSLLDLGGVCARPPAEAWLDAFVHTPPSPHPLPTTVRTRLAVSAGALGRAWRTP
jgi:hypothetical protein